ncbi:hypothetical protein Pcinc_015079 [Petrolisthes cinctipes]|uniref:Secreted protein n=1 Tax=Petrolisthes cinctipes TaxID=88211 RepID=A0AAE1FVP1_PETCI|nr:hypothetical protein Pcinc_015079 [Petrolisthes cinctipes]
MLAWLLTITLVVLAHSEPSVNDVQEERWDPNEMTSSPSHDINKIVSKISILFGSRPSYPRPIMTDTETPINHTVSTGRIAIVTWVGSVWTDSHWQMQTVTLLLLVHVERTARVALNVQTLGGVWSMVASVNREGSVHQKPTLTSYLPVDPPALVYAVRIAPKHRSVWTVKVMMLVSVLEMISSY